MITVLCNNKVLHILWLERLRPGAELEVNMPMKLGGSFVPSGTIALDHGTYIVRGNLDMNGMNHGGTGVVGPNRFSSIGEDAAVIFGGQSASFDALRQNFSWVRGRFGVHGGCHYTNTASALNVASNATLEYALGDPDFVNGGSTTNAMVAVPGTCSIADGAVVCEEARLDP
jgi:hypothetical protein